MKTRSTRKTEPAGDSRMTDKVKNILEEVIAAAAAEPQLDSFYAAKVRALREADPDFFQVFAKRFLKASHRERELLLPLLRHVQGVAHITFLQNFVARETFLPRTGMMILDLFNKSDAMLESGIASRLLDLDALARRLTHAVLQGTLDAALLDEFRSLGAGDREGMLLQLREETGVKFAVFIVRALERDQALGREAVEFAAQTPEATSLQILNEVFAQTGRKEIAKVIKKMAHCLRQKGVDVEVPVSEAPQAPVFRQATLPEPRAFVSIVDAEGIRMIFMIKPVSVYETKIFNILLSDGRGIHDIEVITSLRRETRLFVKRLIEGTKIEFLETELPYAAFLVEEACRITQEQGGIVSGNIAQWRTAFADSIGKRRRPLIHDHIHDDAVAAVNLPEVGPELIEAMHCGYWFAATPEARDGWMKLANILYSPLVLTEDQKNERLDEFVRETAGAFFTPERRRRFIRRLEESALFLYRRNQADLAAAALAAAKSLDAPELQPADNAFCRTIIRSGFSFFEKAYARTSGTQSGRSSGSGGSLLSA